MFLNYAHVFLVVAFVMIWGLIAQFAFIKSPAPYVDPAFAKRDPIKPLTKL